MTSAEQVALELFSGSVLVLQRMPIRMTEAEIYAALAAACHLPIDAAEDILAPSPEGRIRLIHAHGWLPERFHGWDARRASLCGPNRPAVVILDVMAATSILRAAPQCCA